MFGDCQASSAATIHDLLLCFLLFNLCQNQNVGVSEVKTFAAMYDYGSIPINAHRPHGLSGLQH